MNFTESLGVIIILRKVRMLPDVVCIDWIKDVLAIEETPDATRGVFMFVRAFWDELLGKFGKTITRY